VKLAKDQNHGKIYGRLVWRGLAKGKDMQISTALKPQWSLISMPDYGSFKGTAEEVNSFIPTNVDRTV
jgi:hypothetical protein